MRVSVTLYTARNGEFVADWTSKLDDLEWTDNQHGFADGTISLPYPRRLAYLFYERVSGWLVIAYAGRVLWEGRFEDATIDSNGQRVSVTGFGAWRAFADIPYTAFWSDTRLDAWEAVPDTIISTRTPDRYELSTDGGLVFKAQKDTAYDTSHIGSLSYAIPSGSSRQISVIQFDYSFTAPNSTWTAALSRYTQAYAFSSSIWTLTGNNATQSGSVYLTLTATDRLMFSLYFNQAATTLGTVTNPVSTTLGTTTTDVNTTLGTTTLDVNTNLGTNIAAGVRVVTPGSMTGITAGRVLDIGGTTAETITVTSVTVSTFTATFAQAHTSADAVTLGPNSVTVTPVSMTGIVTGRVLIIGGTSGVNEETVTVTGTGGSTFTAVFEFAHSSTDSVTLGPNPVVSTPASMSGIFVNNKLDIGGSNPEQVVVTAATAYTFTATYAKAHSSSDPVQKIGTMKVTPASMTGISSGTMLAIGNNGAATRSLPEDVRVLTTTATTFTAEFQYPHASTDTVTIINQKETGDIRLTISNLRIASSTTQAISTTLTNAVFIPGTQTLTVGSTTNMYVGQRLIIGSATPESVVILTIPTSTTITAAVTKTHAATSPINAIFIQPERMIVDMINAVATANSTQISTSTGLIQQSGLDLMDEVYEDADMREIMERLASLGDTQSPNPRIWEIGVRDNQMVYYRPRASLGKTWYVRVVPPVSRSIERHYSSAYSVHQDSAGATTRGSVSTDTVLVNRYGLIRRAAVQSQTSSSVQANILRDAFLYDHKYAGARDTFEIDALYDAYGTRWPLWHCKTGDTLVLRTLPLGVSAAVDAARQFRVDAITLKQRGKVATITPESRPPTLAFLLARAELRK